MEVWDLGAAATEVCRMALGMSLEGQELSLGWEMQGWESL